MGFTDWSVYGSVPTYIFCNVLIKTKFIFCNDSLHYKCREDSAEDE